LMKKNYLNFHTENVENRIIETHLSELSKGQLKIANPEELMSTNQILQQYGVTTSKPKQKGKPKKRKKL